MVICNNEQHHLVSMFAPLVGNTPHQIKTSQDSHKFKTLKLDPDETLSCYDVTLLFTCILTVQVPVVTAVWRKVYRTTSCLTNLTPHHHVWPQENHQHSFILRVTRCCCFFFLSLLLIVMLAFPGQGLFNILKLKPQTSPTVSTSSNWRTWLHVLKFVPWFSWAILETEFQMGSTSMIQTGICAAHT